MGSTAYGVDTENVSHRKRRGNTQPKRRAAQGQRANRKEKEGVPQPQLKMRMWVGVSDGHTQLKRKKERGYWERKKKRGRVAT